MTVAVPYLTCWTVISLFVCFKEEDSYQRLMKTELIVELQYGPAVTWNEVLDRKLSIGS